jgi:outer membrane protein TolC
MTTTFDWRRPKHGHASTRAAVLVSTLCVGTFGLASTVAAQTPSGGLSGSVLSGAATTDVLPLTLADAVDRGLKYNLAVITFDQQVESARGARLRSLRDLLPRVDARAGETRQTTNLAAFGFDSSLFPGIPSIVGPFNIFDARISASQAVLDLGARRDLASKTAALSAVRLDEENARDVVTFVVTSLYFQAVAGDSRIQTARSQVSTAEALLTQATNLRNAGAAPGIDVVRAQVQVQAQRQRLIAAENDRAKQLLQLARAIGVPTRQQMRLSDTSMSTPGGALSLDDALTRAADVRADYKASLERVHAAEAALESTRAGRLPSVHVGGDYGTIGTSPADARRTYSMSANVRVPLFDQDRAGRQIENMSVLKQRQAESADLAQRIEADVRTAVLDVQSTEQQLAVARERVSLANQELSLARIRFTAGVTSNLEVIQAQNEVAAAADNEVAGTYAFNLANAALTRAIGGTPTTP